MKLLIAGSRSITNVEFIESVLDGIRLNAKITHVVSGMARGPDMIGKEWADKHLIPVLSYPANWTKYKGAAGPIRNSEMSKEADALIAFWDGKSSGTRDMIKKMERLNKPTRVIVIPTVTEDPKVNTLDF